MVQNRIYPSEINGDTVEMHYRELRNIMQNIIILTQREGNVLGQTVMSVCQKQGTSESQIWCTTESFLMQIRGDASVAYLTWKLKMGPNWIDDSMFWWTVVM